MSLTKEYPAQNPVISSQSSVSVANPAASPSGTLVSQVSLRNLSKDVPAFIATQFGAGTYLVILSAAVNGNPAATDKVPGLITAYCYSENGPNSNSVEGPTSQGSDVVDGFTASESVEFSHNGEGVISAGTLGGVYLSEWTYNATISIYKLS
jgi:hypothetical protein